MGYLTGSIQPGKFKVWLYFAVGDIILNGSILGIKGTELMERLKEIWPEVEIIAGIASAGLIFAFLAGILVLMFRIQIFVEILQTADLAAVLYAFYSFKPAIIKLPAGIFIFVVVILFFVFGYIVAQIPFIKLVYKSGNDIDKLSLGIIIAGSIVIFVAPAIALIFI